MRQPDPGLRLRTFSSNPAAATVEAVPLHLSLHERIDRLIDAKLETGIARAVSGRGGHRC